MTSREYILNAIKFHKPELAKFGIRNIGLFGSYVSGEVSEDSDIDILIEFTPGKESYDNFMAVYDTSGMNVHIFYPFPEKVCQKTIF